MLGVTRSPYHIDEVTERIAQVAQRTAFPSPVPQLEGDVKMLGVELYRLVIQY